MIATGWIGLQWNVFPRDWQEYGSNIGWVGYIGAGVALGLVSTVKSDFLLDLSSPSTSKATTIAVLLLVDIAATGFLVLVGLAGFLWVWWNILESSRTRLGDVLVWLLSGTFVETHASIYLPIAAATYTPCLLLAVLLIARMLSSWFSLLAEISDRFDSRLSPLTTPLVGAVVMGAVSITVMGLVAKIINVVL